MSNQRTAPWSRYQERKKKKLSSLERVSQAGPGRICLIGSLQRGNLNVLWAAFVSLVEKRRWNATYMGFQVFFIRLGWQARTACANVKM